MDVTAQGFRSQARDWTAERTREVRGKALAQTVEDKTEPTYRRGDLLAKRRELMAEGAGIVTAACIDERYLETDG